MPSYNQILGSGDDDRLYDLSGNSHILTGAGNDLISAGDKVVPMETNIFDGGSGEDTVNYYGQIRVVADLGSGTGMRFDPMTGLFKASDQYVNIENLTGGLFDDILTGDGGANRLVGGEGSDTIHAGGGNDRIQGNEGKFADPSLFDDHYDGGAGSDFLYYLPRWISVVHEGFFDDSPGAIAVDLGAGSAHGHHTGHDTLNSIENVAVYRSDGPLIGSIANNVILSGRGSDLVEGLAGNDRLHGEAGDDTLLGGLGDDYLEGGHGQNTLDGGVGEDTVSISQSSVQRVIEDSYYYEFVDPYMVNSLVHATVDLAAGTSMATYEDGSQFSNDTLISIENVITYAGNDFVTGDDVANVLETGDGNDQIMAGGGHDTVLAGAGNDILEGGLGNDILDGGEGIDRLLYTPIGGGTVDLEAGTTSGILGNDSLSGIEDVWTGIGHDHVIGSAGANEIRTDDGNDMIEAGGGADVVHAGTGNDTIDGGSGDDDLFGAWGDDTIRGGAGNDLIALGPGGTDTVVWGASDDIGIATDEVLNFDVGTDQLQFLPGFFAEQRSYDIDQLLRATSNPKGTYLEANTADSGWETIARFDGLDVAQLETVINNDVLIMSTELEI